MNNQQPISVSFIREWRIKRPYLYRYLDKKFVDDFFKTGDLRLSSFKEFSKHPHELCRDKEEGSGTVVHKNSKGKGAMFTAQMSQGHESYILCSSTVYHKQIAKKFGANSGFRINDISSFANAISAYLPGFMFGMEGQCQYFPERVIYGDVGEINLEKMKDSEGNLDIREMLGLVSIAAGDNLFFLKQDDYLDEYEYRLIWNTADKTEDFIDIKCPGAVQFCTRFEDLSTLT